MTKVIFFDFDGVILDSMHMRDIGFEIIAKEATKSQKIIDDFIKYHRYNAGLSRYVKIRYLYEELLGEEISETKVNAIASKFSILMKKNLTNPEHLIDETVEFIKNNHQNFILHIVSGSDHKELNFLCEELKINKYFKTIEGSPTHKNILVKDILSLYEYNTKECILIGDSITDYNASKVNNIKFYGYNNIELKNHEEYILSFKSFDLN